MTSAPNGNGITTLTLLAVAGFAATFTLRVCDAMLPALATVFATSTAEAATVVSAFALTFGLMQLVYGALGDRYGKPRVIAFATAWCALATLAASLAPTLQSLVLARAATGAGAAAIVPLALAWIGDTVPIERRQAVLARYSSATLGGIVVGTWAGGFLTEALSWRAALVATAPLFAAVALMLGRHVGADRAAAHAAPAAAYHRRIAELLASRWARIVLATVFIEGMFSFGFLAFLPAVLHARFALPLTTGGMVLALFALGGFAYSRIATHALARWSPHTLVVVAGALIAIGFALLAAMPHWSFALAACPMAGLGFYALHNAVQVNATQLSTSSRGLAVSLFASCLFMGQSAGVTLASLVFADMRSAWGFGLSSAVLGALGWAFGRQLRKRHAPPVAEAVQAD